MAFAAHVQGSVKRGETARLVIGSDGRGSGAQLSAAAAEGLMACGFDVVDIGIVATPTVGVMIAKLGAVGGIAVTASHNPIEWNGLKTLNADGLALPIDDAKRVISRFHAGDFAASPTPGHLTVDGSADETHVAKVLAEVDIELIRSRKWRVVLDSVNGGGARSGKLLLDALGCDVIHLNGERTGTFAHTPEPLEANLGQLMDAVATNGTIAVGFAQDPDADRLALVDERGRFVGEEYTLVLGVTRLLQRAGRGCVATNLSTSRMIDDLVAKYPDSRVVRTAVGEANVVDGIRRSSGIGGGEGNGGLIWPRICWVRDSLGAMALILELLSQGKQSLSTLAAGVPAYSMIKRKMELATVGGQSAIAPALAKVSAHFRANPVARIDSVDGIRIDLPQGWVHLRASNTEPIIRVIAEASSSSAANALCDECQRAAGLA